MKSCVLLCIVIICTFGRTIKCAKIDNGSTGYDYSPPQVARIKRNSDNNVISSGTHSSSSHNDKSLNKGKFLISYEIMDYFRKNKICPLHLQKNRNLNYS